MNDIGTPSRNGFYFQTGTERRWFSSLAEAVAAAQVVASATGNGVRIWHKLTIKKTVAPCAY